MESADTVKSSEGSYAVSVQRATVTEAPAIKAIIDAAYSKYIERIGKPPAPMLADYAQLIDHQDVFVLRQDYSGTVVGSILLSDDPKEKSLKINNLVVDPSQQGRGYGRILMNVAKEVAVAKGFTALTLFTNVKMVENLTLYTKLGFTETDRRTENGYERVFFRYNLCAPQ